MALSVTHSTVVVTADDPNYEVGSDEWNAAHSVSGILGAVNGGTGVANNAASTITISGAFGLTLTLSAATSLTLPTSGTLPTTSDKLSVFAATTSAELAGVISDETGSGALVFATSPTLVTPALGTPASGTLTNCTGLPISSGVSGLAAGVATFLATPSSANLIAAVTDETGTGALVFATSPTLVTPALGTPASGTLTNCTGLPISTGVSGLAAGISTWLATPSSANLAAAVTDETGTGALVFANSPTLVTPILGTPTSGTLTNCTGLPIGTGVSGLGAGVATFLATPSSANLASAVTDETGTGVLVFGTSPTFTTGITVPLVIGGTGVGSTLILESTSGVGTTDYIAFKTGSQTERWRIDNSGRLLYGGVLVDNLFGDSSPSIAIGARAAINVWSGDANGPSFYMQKSRNATPNAHTVVQSGDGLGGFWFTGSDGTVFTAGAFFGGEVDGTPGTNDMPGRLKFSTTADGQNFPTERLRIDNAGRAIYGGTATLAVGGNDNQLQNWGTTAATGALSLGMFSATAATCAEIDFYRSKNAAVGSATVVASGDALGSITFYGAQQTGTFATQNPAARIIAEVDGTVTSGAGADMPGRLRLLTTPDASGTLTERIRVDSAGLKHFTNGAFGYGFAGNGDGGTVTQLTNKSTGVTLSTENGQITMNSAALAASTTVTFTLTNTLIAATDHLLLHHQSAGTAGSYTLNAQCAAGSATINVRNVSLGSLSEAIVIGFILVKGTTN